MRVQKSLDLDHLVCMTSAMKLLAVVGICLFIISEWDRSKKRVI